MQKFVLLSTKYFYIVQDFAAVGRSCKNAKNKVAIVFLTFGFWQRSIYAQCLGFNILTTDSAVIMFGEDVIHR